MKAWESNAALPNVSPKPARPNNSSSPSYDLVGGARPSIRWSKLTESNFSPVMRHASNKDVARTMREMKRVQNAYAKKQKPKKRLFLQPFAPLKT